MRRENDTREGMVTQIELQEHLGNMLRELMSVDGGTKQFQATLNRAEYVAKISKQIINSADIVVRGNKLSNRTVETEAVIGHVK